MLTIGAAQEDGLPLGTEYRLAQFAQLVASAISNSQAREDLGRVAAEQAALRRVATLVAEGAPASTIFATVAEEVSHLLGQDSAVWRFHADGTGEIIAQWTERGEGLPVGLRIQHIEGSLTAIVRETSRPARVDRYDDDNGRAAREIGVRSSVGVPIIVEGEPWGLIAIVSTTEEPPPLGTEERLVGFTELAATAIANVQAREELRTIADEQASLRRVATLVAQGATPEDVLTAVAEEVGRVVGVDFTSIGRYHRDGAETVVGAWSRSGAPAHFPIGTRLPGEGVNIHTQVFRTHKPARLDAIVDDPGAALAPALAAGIRAAVGVPISVEGRLWGVIISSSTREEPLPPETEMRMAGFTELAATAIANAEARIELRRYAEEQASLRRVATVVAQGMPPEDVFAAVTEEVGQALGSDFTGMSRYNGDGTATVLGEWTKTDVPPRWESASISISAVRMSRHLSLSRVCLHGSTTTTTQLRVRGPMPLEFGGFAPASAHQSLSRVGRGGC